MHRATRLVILDDGAAIVAFARGGGPLPSLGSDFRSRSPGKRSAPGATRHNSPRVRCAYPGYIPRFRDSAAQLTRNVIAFTPARVRSPVPRLSRIPAPSFLTVHSAGNRQPAIPFFCMQQDSTKTED